MTVNDIDYEALLSKRLTELREQKKVSAREMSLSLGQGHGYINKIENGQSMPSMQGFFYICQYLDVTPEEFFNMNMNNPGKLKELIETLKTIHGEQLEHLHAFIIGLKNK